MELFQPKNIEQSLHTMQKHRRLKRKNNEKEDKEEEMPSLENQPGDENKFNRNEKKCRKALMKVGMKQMSGITRITLKKRDGTIFVIDDPEVLNLDNSYAIFGELKLEDLNR